MDLRTLRYFTVVAEELNIPPAAERLCMSQPPLSNQMKALEEELGVKLFIRGKRQLQLTDAGRLLLLRATQILDMTEKAQREVMSLEGGMSGTINLGIVEGRAPFLIARWIAGFKEEFPNVKDVESQAVVLFGPDVKLEHKTIGDMENAYQYDSEIASYHVPIIAMTGFATPSVQKIVMQQESCRLTIGYEGRGRKKPLR